MVSQSAGIFLWEIGTFAFWQEGFLFPGLALHELHLLLQKMLIAAATAVTLLVFAVLIAILIRPVAITRG
jgi:hypothetical protein